MPQFITSPTPFASPSLLGVPPPAAAGGIIPYNRQRTLQDPTTTASSSSSSSSVRLSCLGPDSRSVHTFVIRDCVPYIESYSLPLPGTTENENEIPSRDNSPDLVRTCLPDRVRAALGLFPPVELLSLGGEGESASSSSSLIYRAGEIRKLPKLCLYTKKDVFLLEMGYDFSGEEARGREVEGVVLSVTEPFDKWLGTSTSTTIIRVRQAPQQHMGFATMCPPDCIAMLALDPSINEYSLSLFHGQSNNDITTTPVAYGTELIEDRTERITDFCFCQSNKLSLLASLTVAFLKGSGEVLVANPIVFRGTVVASSIVADTLAFVDSELKQCQTQSPRWRQLKSAKGYIMDVFPDDGRTRFVTAQASSDASEWTVQVQGPVLLAAETDDFETSAMAIEPLFADDLVGLAVGHAGDVVEFGLLSPSTFVPRFTNENHKDTYQLGKDTKRGASVCRVDLRDDEESYHQSLQAAVGLIPDPIMNTVVHYVTPSSIKSISTNTLQITANKIGDRQQLPPSTTAGGAMFSPPSKRKDAPARTTAWSCFDASAGEEQGNQVIGAIVSGDALLGHTMVSLLSSGSLVAINLTEARQCQEMGSFDESQNRRESISGGDKALRVLQETPALIDLIEPLQSEVIKGLSNMAKIVGSATSIQEMTATDLAAATSVKSRCEKEVLLPLIKIMEFVRMRTKELGVMHANQLAQLSALKGKIETLKKRKQQVAEKAEIVKTNAISLAQRSAVALQTSSDLQPTLTQAEYDYFTYLKGVNAKLKEYEEVFSSLKLTASALEERESPSNVELDHSLCESLSKVLRGSENKLRDHKESLKDIEEKIDVLNIAVGFDSMSTDVTGQ